MIYRSYDDTQSVYDVLKQEFFGENVMTEEKQKYYVVKHPRPSPPPITIQKIEPDSETYKFLRMLPSKDDIHIEEWVAIEDYEYYKIKGFK